MRLGVFDSGLGGLLIAKAIRESSPEIDMVYAGDTLHLPYGNRSAEAILAYTLEAIEFLFSRDCALIIVACNTASAGPLRRVQQDYLPRSSYADRRVLGVIVPTLEVATEKGARSIGLIATHHTVQSEIYEQELFKINPEIRLHQVSTPLLVPLIENQGMKWIDPILEDYLLPLKQKGIDTLILGCTHYSLIKGKIQRIMGPQVALLSQDEIIPDKVIDYLQRHPEINHKITRTGDNMFYVSDLTHAYRQSAAALYGLSINIEKADFVIKRDSIHAI